MRAIKSDFRECLNSSNKRKLYEMIPQLEFRITDKIVYPLYNTIYPVINSIDANIKSQMVSDVYKNFKI